MCAYALRDETHQLDGLECLPRGERRAGIVHGALSNIPGVQMSREHDDLVRELRAADLSDRVVRGGVRQSSRSHLKPNGHRGAAVAHLS